LLFLSFSPLSTSIVSPGFSLCHFYRRLSLLLQLLHTFYACHFSITSNNLRRSRIRSLGLLDRYRGSVRG